MIGIFSRVSNHHACGDGAPASETGKRKEVINEKTANFLEQHEVDV